MPAASAGRWLLNIEGVHKLMNLDGPTDRDGQRRRSNLAATKVRYGSGSLNSRVGLGDEALELTRVGCHRVRLLDPQHVLAQSNQFDVEDSR